MDGNHYLDFAIGSGSMSLGGAPESLVRTLTERAGELAHGSYPYLNPAVIEFAEKLSSITPGKTKKMVAMLATGSEAADFRVQGGEGLPEEAAVHQLHRRSPGFSLGALALSGHYAAMFRNHPHLVPGITHTPYAYATGARSSSECRAAGLACADYIEETLLTTISPPENTAGLIRGADSGACGHRSRHLRDGARVYEICRKNGILYIDDEVFAGLGRTGKMFAIEDHPRSSQT